MKDLELFYLLALHHVPKVGDITAKKLIAHCGSPQSVLEESKKNLLKIEGIGSVIVDEILNKNHLDLAEKELQYIQNKKIKVTSFEDVDYPDNLKQCIDGPILLFSKGNIDLKNKKLISIVGTRNATSYGVSFCEKLVEELAIFNPVIVSGFAYGIDITSHKAAVKHGLQTIGCLAHGFNTIYPKVHKKYMSEMEENGGFLTDFWSIDDFDRNNFLRRNRIIAGLSEATIVIESSEKGGSLVTADIANSYDREVFALPGRFNESQSVGCNNLIKFQKAHMLTNPMDVPYILNWQLQDVKKSTVQKQLFVELDENEKTIYKFLNDNNQQMLDVIALECGLP
ncbi:DNA-processing protein DprA, partial [Aegicerativicinus sediminis]